MSAVWVEQSFERVRRFQQNTFKAKIMEFKALENQPFSVVGDVGFRRLVEHQVRYLSDVELP
jgi:hypothetical protein